MLTEVLRTIASSLQAPVIVVLIALVVVMVVIVGMFIAEIFTERRYFTVSLSKLVDQLHDAASGQQAADAIRESGLLMRQKKILLELLAHPQIDGSSRESLAVNLVSEEQARFDKRVKVTDTIAKVAPMLGLMGTLIPLGPGLIAIGEGDTQVLSESLLIAFDTTILGLVVAAIALVISVIRKTWYARYMSAFESAAECTLEKASEFSDGSVKPHYLQPNVKLREQPSNVVPTRPQGYASPDFAELTQRVDVKARDAFEPSGAEGEGTR